MSRLHLSRVCVCVVKIYDLTDASDKRWLYETWHQGGDWRRRERLTPAARVELLYTRPCSVKQPEQRLRGWDVSKSHFHISSKVIFKGTLTSDHLKLNLNEAPNGLRAEHSGSTLKMLLISGCILISWPFVKTYFNLQNTLVCYFLDSRCCINPVKVLSAGPRRWFCAGKSKRCSLELF